MTDKAQKLLRLALDAGAMDGEWRNAAVMFIGALRKNGTTADSFTAAIPESRRPAPPHRTYEPPAVTMPFGKHKGRKLADIPSDYLDWLQTNCDLRPRLKMQIAGEIQRRRNAADWTSGPLHAEP